MVVRLASARAVGRILFMFGIQGFIHPRSMLGESEHSSFKIMGPKTKW
jgi:hypothetical protein